MAWADLTSLLLFGYAAYLGSELVLSAGFALAGWMRSRKRAQCVEPDLDPKIAAALEDPQLPAIALVLVARNDAERIVETVRAYLSIFYPRLGIILIDDGSTDGTLERLTEALELAPMPIMRSGSLSTAIVESTWVSRRDPRLRVIRQGERGHACALNTGLDFSAESPLLCTAEAGIIPEDDALLRMLVPFLESKSMVAVQGAAQPLAGAGAAAPSYAAMPADPRALVQFLEWTRAVFLTRGTQRWIFSRVWLAPGITVYLRQGLLEISGFSENAGCERLDALLRIRAARARAKEPCHFRLVSEKICGAPVPTHFRSLARERLAWGRGLADALRAQGRSLGNPKTRGFGLLNLPYLYFYEWLGPVLALLTVAVASLHDSLGAGGLSGILLVYGLLALTGLALRVATTLLALRAEHPLTYARLPRRLLIRQALREAVVFRSLLWLFASAAHWPNFRRRPGPAKAIPGAGQQTMDLSAETQTEPELTLPESAGDSEKDGHRVA